MILDKQNQFSDAQAIASTDASTNIIDLGPLTNNTSRDIGSGENLFLVVGVQAAFTTGSATTLAIALQGHSASGFSAQTILASSGTISSATLATTGPVWTIRLPPATTWPRFIRLNYTVATGPFTAGNLDANIVKDLDQATKLYADNVAYS